MQESWCCKESKYYIRGCKIQEISVLDEAINRLVLFRI